MKSINGWERTPFYISANELAVADERRAELCLLGLWSFSRKTKAVELYPQLEAHVALSATSFRAAFR